MSAERLPLISVLLPVFNGGKYLSVAVRSIIQQTYQNWELLILDDGSTDGAVDALKKTINDPRITIYSDGFNYGLSQRLNQGAQLSKGKYIARMDADDFSFPNRFHVQFEFLENHPNIDLLGSRAIVFRNEDPMIVGLLPYRQFHNELLEVPWRGIPLPHPTWMGRREWFLTHQYCLPEVKRAEDQDLLLRASKGSIYHCLPNVLLAYRQTPFDVKKTRIARLSMASFQVKYFFKNREYLNLIASSTMLILKLFIDSVASIKGCEKLFFARMAFEAPVNVKLEFHQIYKDLISD
jgi:glycosyltransferase involved in cell wall biosynthesis